MEWRITSRYESPEPSDECDGRGEWNDIDFWSEYYSPDEYDSYGLDFYSSAEFPRIIRRSQ